MEHQTTAILRRPKVSAMTGMPRSTLYDRIKKGLFVPPISLGARASGWPDDEVAAINRARIRGASDEELRELVQRLVGARATEAAAEAPE